MSIASAATLLVAELDLKLVQSVLSAIRAADLESAAEKKPPLPVLENPLPAVRTNVCREGLIEHAPQHAAQKVTYTARPCRRPAPAQMPVVVETIVVNKKTDDMCSPLAAPWKQLPWDAPPAPRVKIKINRYQPDTHHTGTMIDYFI